MLIVYVMIVDGAGVEQGFNGFHRLQATPSQATREAGAFRTCLFAQTWFGTFASPIRFGLERGLLRQKNNNKESQ